MRRYLVEIHVWIEASGPDHAMDAGNTMALDLADRAPDTFVGVTVSKAITNNVHELGTIDRES